MTVTIELFLLDNFVMNLLMIRLAAVMAGKRLRWYAAALFAAAGALYAFLSVTAAPFLTGAAAKLLFGAAAACLLMDGRHGYLRALASLFFAAFLLGGLVLGVTMLFGGRIGGGALIGTIPVRIALLCGAVCTALPRLLRSLMTAYRHRARYTRIRIMLPDRAMELRALIDSGNLLTEPITGLPVVLVRPGLLEKGGGLPVAYAGVDGHGIVYAQRPDRLLVHADGWREADALVAETKIEFAAAEAIIGAELYFAERKLLCVGEADEDAEKVVCNAADVQEAGDMVYPFRGDAADAVCAGGGERVDRAAHARREGSGGCADRT